MILDSSNHINDNMLKLICFGIKLEGLIIHVL